MTRKKRCVDCGSTCQATKVPYRCQRCYSRAIIAGTAGRLHAPNEQRQHLASRKELDRMAELAAQEKPLFPPRERYVRRLESQTRTVHGIETKYGQSNGV